MCQAARGSRIDESECLSVFRRRPWQTPHTVAQRARRTARFSWTRSCRWPRSVFVPLPSESAVLSIDCSQQTPAVRVAVVGHNRVMHHAVGQMAGSPPTPGVFLEVTRALAPFAIRGASNSQSRNSPSQTCRPLSVPGAMELNAHVAQLHRREPEALLSCLIIMLPHTGHRRALTNFFLMLGTYPKLGKACALIEHLQ